MVKKRFILALDIGSSSLKGAIFDSNVELVAKAKEDYHYDVLPKMGVEIPVERIWQACLKIFSAFKPYLSRLAVIVPSVFCPSVLAMDEEGNSLCPAIIHIDRRSYPEARQALKKIGKEKFLAVTGNLPYPGGTSLSSLLWLKKHCNDVFNTAAMFGHVNTFLVKKLTGKWAIDQTHASLTCLYETAKGNTWNKDLTKSFEISQKKLPPVVRCDTIVGHITDEAARQTGIPSGIPVVMGANDTSCAATGAGVVENGNMLNIVGSSEIFVVCTNKPFPNERWVLRQHAVEDKWLMFVITTAGFSLEWFRKEFCRDMNKKEFYQSYLPDVLQREGSSSVRFTPYLAGDRTSFTAKRAALAGLTLSTTRKDCLKAVIDASMAPMREAVDELQKLMKLDTTVVLTGGGLNPTVTEYKKKMFPDFTFKEAADCSLQGAALLGKGCL